MKLYSPKTYGSTNRREKYIQQKTETKRDRQVVYRMPKYVVIAYEICIEGYRIIALCEYIL